MNQVFFNPVSSNQITTSKICKSPQVRFPKDQASIIYVSKPYLANCTVAGSYLANCIIKFLLCKLHDSRLPPCELHDRKFLSCKLHDSRPLPHKLHDKKFVSCKPHGTIADPYFANCTIGNCYPADCTIESIPEFAR